MRRLVILLAFSLGSCGAQTTSSKPVEVPSVGVIYVLDSSNQALKPLPDEAFKGGHSSVFKTAYGKSPMTGSFDVSGAHSSFRIAAGKPEFVFTFGSPENAILYVSTDSKNERRFASVQINRDNSVVNLPGIPVVLTQFGNSSYKLVPASPLHPGEYAIVLRGSPQAKDKKIFTFGID